MPPMWFTAVLVCLVVCVVLRQYRFHKSEVLLDAHARRRASGEAGPRMSPWREAHRMLRDGQTEGLRALEAMAQDDPKLRQTVVDAVCAALRGGVLLGLDAAWRTTLQQSLAAHLRPGPRFWAGMDVTLTGATVVDLDLTGCRMRVAGFGHVRFRGDCRFDAMTATHRAGFDEARFGRHANFDEALFAESASFRGAVFTGNASFAGVRVAGEATFDHALFSGRAVFAGAQFADVGDFRSVRFGGRAYFTGAVFAKAARFERTWFRGHTDVGSALFAEDPRFDGTRFGHHVPR